MAEPRQQRGSSRQDYRTPDLFLSAVTALLGIEDFEADLAASPENRVTDIYYTEADNALHHSWRIGEGWNWLNPPFSKIRPWVEKAWKERLLGAQTCVLVPAGVGANWFSEFAHQKTRVVFLNGRITFGGCEDPYPKDLMLLLYSPYHPPSYEVWRWK